MSPLIWLTQPASSLQEITSRGSRDKEALERFLLLSRRQRLMLFPPGMQSLLYSVPCPLQLQILHFCHRLVFFFPQLLLQVLVTCASNSLAFLVHLENSEIIFSLHKIASSSTSPLNFLCQQLSHCTIMNYILVITLLRAQTQSQAKLGSSSGLPFILFLILDKLFNHFEPQLHLQDEDM